MAQKKPGSSGSSRSQRSGSPKGSAKGAAAKKSGTAAKPETSATKRKPPAPNVQERIEGIQGWMAEIERKQERAIQIGGAALVLALVAAVGALVLGALNQQSAASDDEVDELREQIAGLQGTIKRTTAQQLKGLNETIGSLDQRVEALKKSQNQSAETITSLQREVNRLRNRPAGAGAPGGGGGGGGGGLLEGLGLNP